MTEAVATDSYTRICLDNCFDICFMTIRAIVLNVKSVTSNTELYTLMTQHEPHSIPRSSYAIASDDCVLQSRP